MPGTYHQFFFSGQKRAVACLQEPSRPYKDLDEYRASIVNGSYRIKAKGSAWPCHWCNADGWIYDPNEDPDPVEGNKMRGRLTCKHCEGTGEGPKEHSVIYYNAAIEKWKAQMVTFKQRKALLKSALSKLTPEECELLQNVLGNHYGYEFPSSYNKDPKIIKVKIPPCNG